MAYIDSIHNNNEFNTLCSFGNVFICSTGKTTANKEVTFIKEKK